MKKLNIAILLIALILFAACSAGEPTSESQDSADAASVSSDDPQPAESDSETVDESEDSSSMVMQKMTDLLNFDTIEMTRVYAINGEVSDYSSMRYKFSADPEMGWCEFDDGLLTDVALPEQDIYFIFNADGAHQSDSTATSSLFDANYGVNFILEDIFVSEYITEVSKSGEVYTIILNEVYFENLIAKLVDLTEKTKETAPEGWIESLDNQIASYEAQVFVDAKYEITLSEDAVTTIVREINYQAADEEGQATDMNATDTFEILRFNDENIETEILDVYNEKKDSITVLS